jgi:hypothetical protein
MIYAQDVANFLEGYMLNQLTEMSVEDVISIEDSIVQVSGTSCIKYVTGDAVKFTANNGGTLPTGIDLNKFYYLIEVATGFKIAKCFYDAVTGEPIELENNGTLPIQIHRYDFCAISIGWINARLQNFIIPYVERMCRQSFFSIKSITEYLSGNGKNYLVLNHKPINEVTKIEYVLGGNNTFFLNLAMIETIASEGVLKAKRNYEEAFYLPVFAKGDYNIKVTYTYGYLECPPDVKEAIMYLAAEQLLGFIGSRTGGGTSFSMQMYSRSWGARGKYSEIRDDLARQAYAILAYYTTSVVG